jgi:hypothetical protein
MEDWKELEIGNIPSDFFVNENYIIQIKQDKGDMWIRMIIETEDRYSIIEELQKTEYYYRYKLKPLESIRITSKIHDDLVNYYKNIDKDNYSRLSEYLGRKIEIID